jgi:hypothetical protein
VLPQGCERLNTRVPGLSGAARLASRAAKSGTTAADDGCHTFRATGITSYLENGGKIEHAQQIARSAIANHESMRMTKLHDRTSDAISLDEIERILI